MQPAVVLALAIPVDQGHAYRRTIQQGVPHLAAKRGSHIDLEAELRRHRVTRQPEHRLAVQQPEAQWFPWLLGDLPEDQLGAQPGEDLLDKVVVPHGDTPARDHDIRGRGGASYRR